MSKTPITDDASYGWYPTGTNDVEIAAASVTMVDAETACRIESDRAELIEAVRRCMVALDDWVHMYASEQCNEAHVKDTVKRIFEQGGTLAYIADIQHANRELLKRLEGK